MTLGQKQADYFFTKDLQKTGTIHILVVSGANLAIVAGFFLQFKRFIGRRKALLFALIIIWIYALLTGLQPPVVRGAIMVSIAYLAQLFGRQYWDLYGLTIAALVMTVIQPEMITNISFQLSFAATLGIIFLTQPIKSFGTAFTKGWLTKLPFDIGENLAATLAAQVMVDPLILYYFHQFSLIAPVANVLVMPVVLYLTITGFLLLIGGYFAYQVGYIVSFLIIWPASYFTSITTMLARIPYASITVDNVPGVVILGYYFMLAVGLWGYLNYKKSQEQAGRSVTKKPFFWYNKANGQITTPNLSQSHSG